MRKFNEDGLLLAEYQAKLFEKSYDLNCSSPIFLRRFIHSDLSKALDENCSSLVSLDVNEGIDNIISQFSDSNYGKIKYSKESLFWMGYLYRYISYTREESTSFIVSLFDHKLMNNVYYSFHTQDPEWCIQSLLEIKKLDKDIFDKNKRLKKVIKKDESYQNILKMIREYDC